MKTRTLISILLVLLIALTVPAQVMAEEKPVAYIADVMVGMGETADEAKKALTDAGYTVLDQDVNEGAGSKMKTDKYVYIGYKTTDNITEAITDLAVMNMNGGYSFSDYEALMDKYRDSQIKPFIDSFIATIKEYRENYHSSDGANKDKAEFAHTILNRIKEDDTGALMGDLLLNPTKEERGLTDDQYKALSDDEKKKTADLTTALMQGNSQIILLIEQVLATAADTNETTWLERLSELGPDGLEKKYAEKGIRPSDANREMASLYADTAKIILENWTDFRTELLDYQQIRGENLEETAVDDDVLSGVYGDVEAKEYNVETPKGVMECVNNRLESSLKTAESVEDSRIAAVYDALKEAPYGDGSVFDFFTKPYEEVSGDNISALYPMISTLSKGQAAAIEFLPLATLLRIGVMNGEAFEAINSENSDLMELFNTIDVVSIYYDVNREIFEKTTALTSEAQRKNAGGFSFTQPITELGGMSALTTLFWATDAAALTASIYNATKINPYADLAERLGNLTNELASDYKIYGNTRFTIVAGVDAKDPTKFLMGFGTVDAETGTAGMQAAMRTYDIQADMGLAKECGSYDKMKTLIESKTENAMNQAAKFKKLTIVFGAAFAVLTVISIFMTVYDLYRYYNVNYTPIPKYIVDEADITTTDPDGNQIVVRNDAAYYTVALTNREENAEHYKSLEDFSDLNGDVGRQWLALYYNKNVNDEPILADSLKVVKGSTKIPDGYSRSIHMFGSNAAMNLTDSNYTYNDDLNGLYIYFKTAASAPTDTASVFTGGMLAIVGVGGTLVGAAIGALVTVLIKRKKKPQEAE